MLSNLKKLSLSLLTIPLFIAPNNVDAKSIDEIVGAKKKVNTLKKEQAKKQNYFQWSNSYYQEIRNAITAKTPIDRIIKSVSNDDSNNDFHGNSTGILDQYQSNLATIQALDLSNYIGDYPQIPTITTVIQQSLEQVDLAYSPLRANFNSVIIDQNQVATLSDGTFGDNSKIEDSAGQVVANLSLDTDGDGVLDDQDIDDDNDGVLDAVESPDCFYSFDEARIIESLTSEASYASTEQVQLDALKNSQNCTFNFNSGSEADGTSLFTIGFASPIELNSINFLMTNTNSFTTNGSEFIIQGSNDNLAWTDLSTATVHDATATGGKETFAVTQNFGSYQYYKIVATGGSTGVQNIGSINGITFNYGPYVASSFPKASCNADADSDNLYNHLDLDSDQDGCSDANEAGVLLIAADTVAGPYSSNGFATSVQSPSDSNSYKGTYNYNYAINSSLSGCKDTDGDGIPNNIDLDDDNDGIPDVVESGPPCPADAKVSGTPTFGNPVGNLLPTGDIEYTIPVTSNGNSVGSVVFTDYGGMLKNNKPVSTSGNDLRLIFLSRYSSGNPDLPFKFEFIPEPGVVIPKGSIKFTRKKVAYILHLGQVKYESSTIGNPIYVNGSHSVNIPALVNGQTVTPGDTLVECTGTATCTWPYTGSNIYYDTTAEYYSLNYNWDELISSSNTASVNMSIIEGQNMAYDDFIMKLDFSEYYTQECGEFLDTDNDGIPNSLDLDSDGDGCPDSIEAGINVSLLQDGTLPDGTGGTDTTFTNGQTSGVVGANGMSVDVESDDTETATINYSSTYEQYSLSNGINTCVDTDGDGIMDLVDIDDDNDGILDSIESPSCYYTEEEAIKITGISSEIATPTYALENAIDDITTTYASFQDKIDIDGVSVIQFEVGAPIELSSIFFSHTSATQILEDNGGAQPTTAKLQAWNGSTWVDLTASFDEAAVVLDIPITQNTGAYQRYRLYGIDGRTDVAGRLGEIVLTSAGTYAMSQNPKSSCDSDSDFDGDGIYNHLDLDSDNDGCTDAIEAGIDESLLEDGTLPDGTGGADTTFTNGQTSGAVGVNGMSLDVETDDTLAATNNYEPSYDIVIEGQLIMCTDTDGDGIKDLVDIDDDNDGILDTTECNTGLTNNLNLNGSFNDLPSQTFSNVNVEVGSTSWGKYPGSATSTFEIINGLEYVGVPSKSYKVTQLSPDGGSRLGIAYTEACGAKLNNLVAGEEYTFTFYWINCGRASNEKNSTGIEIYMPNGSTYTTEIKPYDNSTWFTEKITFTATAETADFGFKPTSISPAGISIDGVDVRTVKDLRVCWVDTDGDGIPNSQDLDSDNDGCPDSIEAGINVSLLQDGTLPDGTGEVDTTFTNGQTSGAVGTNGMSVDVEENDTNTAENTYDSTYDKYSLSNTLNACADTDGDGVNDLIDIDDDNDGVLDSVESPNCFYSEAEAITITSISSEIDTPTYALENAIDSDALTYASFQDKIDIDGVSVIEFKTLTDIELSSILFSHTTATQILEDDGTAQPTTAKLQAWDGSAWIDLTANFDETAVVLDIPITQNTGAYQQYRLYGVDGRTDMAGRLGEIILTSAGTYAMSQNPKNSCDVDTDGDGIYNHLDLDSDGDGCPDTIEAGIAVSSLQDATLPDGTSAVATTFTNGQTSGAVGINGMSVDVESDDMNTAGTTYESTYSKYAIHSLLNICTDTDGDGIPDLEDIDDDNDGILDNVESPNCYYTKVDPQYAYEKGDRTNSISVTTDWTYNNGILANILDGNTTTDAVRKKNGDFIFPATGATFLQFELQESLTFTDITIYHEGGIFLDSAITGVAQGSHDGVTWIDLTTAGTLLPDGPSGHTLAFTQNTGDYKFYRLQANGGRIDDDEYLREVEFTMDFAPSQYPKLSCDSDTDGDGIYNHLDLDSDGDGCPDAVESGIETSLLQDATLPDGDPAVNTTFTNGQTSGDVGVNGMSVDVESDDSILAENTFDSTYNKYALVETVNACLDTDGDGIMDIDDLDDDNDGILDSLENPCSGLTGAWNYTNTTDGNRTWTATTADGVEVTFNSSYTPGDGSGIIDFSSGSTHDGSYPSLWLNPLVAGSPSLEVDVVWDSTPIDLEDAAVDGKPTVITISFNKEVTNPIIHLERFGGLNPKMLTNSVKWSLLTQDVSLVKLTGNNSLIVNSTSLNRKEYVTALGAATSLSEDQSAAGSVLIKGTFSSVSFETSGLGPDGTGLDGLEFSVDYCEDIDTDGDGVPNHLDLDSDNDACPDALEGDAGFVNSDIENDLSLGDTVDNNPSSSSYGVPTKAGTGQGNTSVYDDSIRSDQCDGCNVNSSLYADTDGDSIANYCDLDDDNDGVLDVDEKNRCYDTGLIRYNFNDYEIYPAYTETTITTANYDLTYGDGINFEPPGDFTYSAINNQLSPYSYSSTFAQAKTNNHYYDLVFSTKGTVIYLSEIRGHRSGGTSYDVAVELLDNGATTLLVEDGNWASTWTDPLEDKIVELSVNPELKIFTTYTARVYFYNVADTSKKIIVDDLELYSYQMCNVDTDTDGTSNHVDLDSDDDGCPDALEANLNPDLLKNVTGWNDGTNGSSVDFTKGQVAGDTSTGYGDNGLSDVIETDDTYTATVVASNYLAGEFLYNPNALDSTINEACKSAGCIMVNPMNIRSSIKK